MIKDIVELLDKNSGKKLSDSTLQLYSNLLRGVLKKCNQTDPKFLLDEKNIDDIENCIDKMSNQSKKAIYASLFQLTQFDKYAELRTVYMKKVNDHYSKGSYSESQKESKISMEELNKTYEYYLKAYKKNPSLQNQTDLLIIILCTGLFYPPRRNEWWNVLLKGNIYKNKDNYYDIKNKSFVFQKYKTADTHGKQLVEIKQNHQRYINRYLKSHNGNSFFVKNDKEQGFQSSADFSKRLNTIFKNSIGKESVSMNDLRILAVNNFRNEYNKIKQLRNYADKMGHSLDIAERFYLKDGK